MRRIWSYQLIILFMLTAACTQQKSWQECNGAVWNTTYHIVYHANNNLDDSIQAVFMNVAQSVSAFEPKSTVGRINRNLSADTDSCFRLVFETAQKINRESNGLFDPTVAPLINLWGYGYKNYTDSIPSDSLINTALQSVGIADCRITSDGRIAKKSDMTEFNFSALAKGLGCDEIGRMLQRNGCTDYMIEIGGEIAVHGINPHHRPWYIMIDAPVDNNNKPVHIALRTIRVTDCGMATSGNYRNYRDTRHGRVSHTIDPKTGYPVSFQPADTVILSATVIAPTAMEADALATACMCMTPANALKMIESDKSRSALLVISIPDNDHEQTLITKNFPQYE